MADDDSEMENLFKRTMPWLGDDPHSLTGFSLVQWMNMQQNPSLGNPMQPNFLNTLPGSTLQNLPTAEISRHLGFTAAQIPQQNNLQFNAQRPIQSVEQLDQLQKSSGALNPLGPLLQSQQPQLCDVPQQPRQNLVNPALTSSHVQPQILQSQALGQNLNSLRQPSALQNHQLQGNISQILPQQQQQILGQNQQQSLLHSQIPDLVNQQAQVSDGQIQLQLLQRLQEQQQALVSQQSALQQVSHVNPLQEQRKLLVDGSQSFSRSLPPTQMLDMPQTQMGSLSQSQIIAQQITKCNNQNSMQFSQPSQVLKLEQQQTGIIPEMQGGILSANPMPNHHSTAGSSNLTGAAAAGHSAITDDIPSCSTSPSTNNGANVAQTILTTRSNRSAIMREGISQSPNLFTSHSLDTISANANLVKELHRKADVQPSVNIAKSQSLGLLTRQNHQSILASQADYLDTSSATSVSLSQNDIISQSNPLSNSQSMFLGDTGPHAEVQAACRNNIHTGANINGQLGTSLVSDAILTKNVPGSGNNFSSNVSSACMLSNYESTKDAQQELSSSMVTQSFGVPDMAFNSIDSAISDSSFMNRGAWGPTAQYQRMRTYTKVTF